jgi:heterodisulfide reductase subunit A
VPVPGSYVSRGKDIPETRNATIRYSTVDEGGKEEDFEMVVLSVGMAPPADVRKLADKFGRELNAHQLCLSKTTNPIETFRPGIFAR